MKPVQVAGVGLWSTHFPSAAAWSERRADLDATRPAARLLSPRIGRYTSMLTRMGVELTEQAATQGGIDAGQAALVFGSAYGEIQIALEQLDMIRAEGVASPARFKNSVHNTASGHAAIATKNQGFSTAIAAGASTFAMTLLEAWGWLDQHGGSAIVVVADEPLPGFLESVAAYEPFGVGLALSVDATADRSKPWLHALEVRDDLTQPVIPENLSANPAAIGLGLVEALLRRQAGIVPLEPGSRGWSVEILAPEVER